MSSDIIKRLWEEHRNIDSLLRILGRQLAGIRQGDKPDYHLMYDIAHFLTYYPDRYHHPFEDLVFARLAELQPELAAEVAGIEKRHHQLAFDGGKLCYLIGEIIDGLFVSRAELLRTGTAYIESYREHLHAEEDGLFNVLESSLTPADRVVLVSAFHWQTDDVFSEEASGEYRHLREAISAQGAGAWPWEKVNVSSCAACSSI